MNAELLLEHFHRLGDAPDAVPRLRRFILELAVQGKLVQSEGQWEYTTLGELGDWGSGGTPNKAYSQYYGGDIPWLVIGDLNDGLVTSAATHITQAGLENSSAKLVEPGTVFVAMYGSIGKTGVAGIRCATNQAIAHCVPDDKQISQAYLLLLLKSIQAELLSKGQGIAQQNISQKILKAHPVHLPPLPEQHRIVAKVEELMALCDRLEVAQQQREAERTRLTAAAWQAVVQAEAPAKVSFALEQLPALTTRPAQVKALRQTILDLAVVGRLTERTKSDGKGADDLLKVIKRKEQAALRKAKMVEPIEQDEWWCDLPANWTWARWDQITDWITYGFTRPMPHVDSGIPIVTSKNVNFGKILFNTADHTTAEAFEGLNDKDKPQRGDLLLTKDGSIGRSAVVETDELFCINQAVAVLWLRSCHFDRRFLQLAIQCSQTQDELLAKTEGVAIKHISVVDFGKMLLPVPPLAEQRRIVAKVEELMALCDGLEAALQAGEALRGKVLEAVVRSETGSTEPPAPARMRQLPVPKVRAQRYEEAEVELAVAAEPVGHTGAMQAVVRRGPGRPPKSGALTTTATRAIEGFLSAHPGWHGKSAILAATGTDAAAWNAAIKELLEAGKVERQGEKKGARYRGK